MAHRIVADRSQRIRLRRKFSREYPSVESGEIPAGRIQRLFQCAAGPPRRLACNAGLAGSRGGARLGGPHRVRVLENKERRIEPRRRAGHRQGHLTDALPHAGGRSEDMHPAVLHGQRTAPGIRQAHADARIFEPDRKACVFISVIGVLYRLEAGLQLTVRVGDLPVREPLARMNDISPAHLPGVDADLGRQQVDVLFGRETALGDAEAPVGAGDHVVGIDGHPEDIEVLVIVRSRRMRTGAVQHRSAQRGVSPGIGDDHALHGREAPVLITGRGKFHGHRMALDVIIQRFLTGVGDLDRKSGIPGHERRVGLHGHILLAAEAAAHQGRTDMDLLPGQLQHLRALPLHVEDRLSGHVEQQSVPLRQRHSALRLHEAVLLPGSLIPGGHHIGGVLNGLCRVPPPERGTAHDVPVRMQKRRVELQRVLRRRHRFERRIVHLHQLRDLPERLRIPGSHHRQHIAHILRDVSLAHHHVPVILQMPDDIAGNVLFEQDSDAVRMRLGPGYVDTVDPRPRVPRVDALRVDHAVQINIVAENAASVDLGRRVDAPEALIHMQFLRILRDLPLFTEKIRRQKDRVLDLLISGAAAEIPADGLLHVGSRGRQRFVQKALCGNDHAGNAEAALHRSRFREAVLVDPHLLRIDPLHGQDFSAFQPA